MVVVGILDVVVFWIEDGDDFGILCDVGVGVVVGEVPVGIEGGVDIRKVVEVAPGTALGIDPG